MPPSSSTDFAALERKIDAIYSSVEKTRKYFLYTMLLSVALVLLPVLGLAVAVPSLMGTMSSVQDLSVLEGL
jgi:hypothetical protein